MGPDLPNKSTRDQVFCKRRNVYLDIYLDPLNELNSMFFQYLVNRKQMKIV